MEILNGIGVKRWFVSDFLAVGCGLNDGSCFAFGCEQSVVSPEGFSACLLCWDIYGI
jgi:hypothetical protein